MNLFSAGEGSARAEFIPVEFPRTKVEIEQYIVKRFLARAMGTQVFPYLGCTVEQNAEADLDFSLTCADKKPRKLELMEIAPLEHVQGAYENAPGTYKSYDFAKYIVDKVLAKSRKYGRPRDTELHLLVYVTDWRFNVSRNTLALLEYWLSRTAHNFIAIYLYLPIDQMTGEGVLLYPTRNRFNDFHPEALRDDVVWNADPKGWKPIRNANES